MVDYMKAIKLPFVDLKKSFIGIIVLAVAFALPILILGIGWLIALIPLLIVSGFIWTTAKENKSGKNKLANWKDYMNFLIIGIKVAIITILYFIPAVIVAFVALAAAAPNIIAVFVNLIQAWNFNAFFVSISAIAAGFSVSALVFLILVLLALLYIPIAILNYLKKDVFQDAFSIGAISKKVWTGKYILTWIIALIYISVLNIVLGTILFVAPTIAFAISSWLGQLSAFTMFGEVYTETK